MMGLPLREFLVKTTNRELRTLKAWEANEYSNPSRTDYYLMQIAQMIRGKDSKQQFKLDDFKIKFEPPKPAKKVMSLEERERLTKLAKAR